VALSELGTEDFAAEHGAFGDDVLAVFDWEASVDARDTEGGTSLRSVRAQIERARLGLAELRG
jgi:argininosuccinate lyase